MGKELLKYTFYSGIENKNDGEGLTHSAYQAYMSLMLHFTKEKYDAFKYRGKTTNSDRTKMKAYFAKKERNMSSSSWCVERTVLHRVGKKYDQPKAHFHGVYDIYSYFIYQFTRDRKSLFTMDDDGFKEWLNRLDMVSWVNHYQADLGNIVEHLNEKYGDKNEFDSLFIAEGINHPDIMKLYLRGDVAIESIILLDSVLGFMGNINKIGIRNDTFWSDLKMKFDKYKPFFNWMMQRNLEYAIDHPIHPHKSETFSNIDWSKMVKEITRDIFCSEKA